MKDSICYNVNVIVCALQKEGIDYEQSVNGAKLCTLKCGGTVDLVCFPKSVSELRRLLEILSTNGFPYAVIGHGSNTLIKDEGYRGALINLKRLKGIFIRDTKVIASAGVSLPYLASFLAKRNVGGLEPLSGIPCSLGGATLKNAGCFGYEISEFVSRVFCLEASSLKTKILRREAIDYRYHDSGGSFNGLIILYTELNLKRIDYDGAELIKKYRERRTALHPTAPSLGSCFGKTRLGIGAGYYIDKSGLKGTKIGGAEVSEKHANFLVNSGNATARDYLDLMELCAEVVKKKFNVILSREIDIIGENGFEQ